MTTWLPAKGVRGFRFATRGQAFELSWQLQLKSVKIAGFLRPFHDYVGKSVNEAYNIIMPKVLHVFNTISRLRERYYAASVGKQSLIKLLSEAEVAEQVYNSNAIENSTLTLEDTEKILLQIDLDRYINEREIFEAKNLARVVSYIDTKAKEQELTLDGYSAASQNAHIEYPG